MRFVKLPVVMLFVLFFAVASQSRANSVARHPSTCSRCCDESGGSSARRRRRKDFRWPESGDTLGATDARLQNAPEQAYEENDCEGSESEVIAEF